MFTISERMAYVISNYVFEEAKFPKGGPNILGNLAHAGGQMLGGGKFPGTPATCWLRNTASPRNLSNFNDHRIHVIQSGFGWIYSFYIQNYCLH
jgi:hypothetical protein